MNLRRWPFSVPFFSNPKIGKEKECKLRGRKLIFIETFYVTQPPRGALKRAAPSEIHSSFGRQVLKGPASE